MDFINKLMKSIIWTPNLCPICADKPSAFTIRKSAMTERVTIKDRIMLHIGTNLMKGIKTMDPMGEAIEGLGIELDGGWKSAVFGGAIIFISSTIAGARIVSPMAIIDSVFKSEDEVRKEMKELTNEEAAD